MNSTLVNLDIACISGEIEHILEMHPNHPYRNAFIIPRLKDKLIAYILNRVQSTYAIAEDTKESEQESWDYICSIDKKDRIQALIPEGIRHIMAEDSEWIERHTPGEIDPGHEPSHWFG